MVAMPEGSEKPWFDPRMAREGLEAAKKAAGAKGPGGDEAAREAAEEAARLEVQARGQPIAAGTPPIPVQGEAQAITAVDALDELQIAEEMSGRVIDQYFYDFPQGSRQVTGLSLAGVRAIARHMASHGEPLTVLEVRFEEGEDAEGGWIGCLAQGKNLRTGETRWGYASQARSMKLRSGQRIPDPYAKAKALNKAQRNALRSFIPEVVVVEMYREWRTRRETQPKASTGAGGG